MPRSEDDLPTVKMDARSIPDVLWLLQELADHCFEGHKGGQLVVDMPEGRQAVLPFVAWQPDRDPRGK